MERDGKTYCDKHHNVETALRCSRCEAYICPDCAVLTPVGYRCRTCGLERSATHSLAPLQTAIGCIVGFVLGFAATALAMSINLHFFLIFAGAVLGGIVGGATALGFIAGVAWPAIQSTIQAGGKISSSAAMDMMFADPWPLVFACVAAAVSWIRLK